jgi:8-oxo-dGTP pyrophosphatase MutT (NUDIX family)
MVPVTLGVLEILVSGVIGTVWLGLLVASFAGSVSAPSRLIEIFGPIALLAYSAIAYGLGVIVDAAADTTERWMLELLWPGFASSGEDDYDLPLPNSEEEGDVEDPSAGPAKKRREIRSRVRVLFDSKKPMPRHRFWRLRRQALSRGGGLVTFMEYQRSRQRIARSIALDLLLILAIGGWFAARVSHVSPGFLASLAVAALAGALAAIRAAERLRHSYEGHLRSLDADGPSTLRAASVCARRQSAGGQVEILVVSTSERAGASHRWTLPKGHIEESERPMDAAVREAGEEAGVAGDIDPDPLRPYLFPDERGAALTVVPFLIRVRVLREATEPGRHRRWCSPKEAKELLREDREAPYTNVHDPVIDEAVARFAPG